MALNVTAPVLWTVREMAVMVTLSGRSTMMRKSSPPVGIIKRQHLFRRSQHAALHELGTRSYSIPPGGYTNRSGGLLGPPASRGKYLWWVVTPRSSNNVSHA